MNKILKAILCAGLCGSMVFAVACGDKTGGDNGGNGGGNKTQKYNPETEQLFLSLGAPDGNYNPFYYTSLSDGQVVSMTQASLITTETWHNDDTDLDEVEAVAGEDYPTIAKDFTITYKDANGRVTTSDVAANGGTTEYEFLIKNGMKFSNGSDLTIQDVLFNFYVYLDPSYTGSNTMYSVDIKGLTAYQENDSNLLEGGEAQTQEDINAATARINAIIEWSMNNGPETDQVKADVELAKKLFMEELETDWNSNSTSWEINYGDNYSFKYAWQAYLLIEGVVEVQRIKNGTSGSYNVRVDENGNEITRFGADGKETSEYKNGKNLTTLDPWWKSDDGLRQASGYTEVGGKATTALYDNVIAPLNAVAYAAGVADAEGNVISGKEAEYDAVTKEWCINYLFDNNTSQSKIVEVITGWATAATFRNELVAQARGERISKSDTPIYYIDGLETRTTTTFNGKDLGETHDVFKITINEIDPAAIWQFGVSIAPMYYYSNEEMASKADGYLAKGENGMGGKPTQEDRFGVKRGNPDFLNDVVKNSDKSGVPMGAGAYKASTIRDQNPTRRSQFDDNNVIYYSRNTYFETMGEGIENAKIKLLRYRVVSEDKIISSLKTGEIDYGEPNATQDNQREVEGESNLGLNTYKTNGYGYLGINASKVKNVYIRRAIMGIMDPTNAVRYYGGALGANIYRSISMTSWADPKERDYNREYIPKLNTAQDVIAYLRNEGGITNIGGNDFTLTFTIAGATEDHPAYNMFIQAADILNEAGFDITVSTDPNALSKLTTGDLQVWAAAWSSGVDPDMYQVYHMDSNATSVRNWGYQAIKDNQGEFAFEYETIVELSEKIEEARAIDSRDARKAIYADCLNLIQKLSVELPIYQRNDLCVYRKDKIDASTLNQTANCYNGLINNIWEVNFL